MYNPWRIISLISDKYNYDKSSQLLLLGFFEGRKVLTIGRFPYISRTRISQLFKKLSSLNREFFAGFSQEKSAEIRLFSAAV